MPLRDNHLHQSYLAMWTEENCSPALSVPLHLAPHLIQMSAMSSLPVRLPTVTRILARVPVSM